MKINTDTEINTITSTTISVTEKSVGGASHPNKSDNRGAKFTRNAVNHIETLRKFDFEGKVKKIQRSQSELFEAKCRLHLELIEDNKQ
jgi:hypothetical protein